MTRFSNFSDEELNAMESAFCNEGLGFLVEELRMERRYRESRGVESTDEELDYEEIDSLIAGKSEPI